MSVRIPAVPNPQEVDVLPAGETLHFRLETSGVVGFAFATSVRGTRFEAADFLGHPRRVYEWDHLRNPADVQAFEQLELDLRFVGQGHCRYVIELRRAGGGGATILDIAYIGHEGDRVVERLALRSSSIQGRRAASGGRPIVPTPGSTTARSLQWLL
jgi:hypothetical protein